MLHEIDIAGVYMAPVVVYGFATLIPFAVLRWFLARIRVLEKVWHPALFEVALYFALLSLSILLF